MEKTMKVARMHAVGAPMQIEHIPVPTPGPSDVLVRVRSCGIVPNLGNILANWTTWFPELPLPPLPAIFGLDPAGEVVAVGKQVHDWKVGERVYVNPGRYCGGCRACRSGDLINCTHYTFNGYFGFSQNSLKIFNDYPYGGLGEYMTAPQYALVRLPDNVSFDQAARFGYLGTAYSALRKGGAGPGKTVLINGISGTLGLGAALFCLAMGVTRILGTGRNLDLLEKVRELAPGRIQVLSTANGEAIDTWVKQVTDGLGADLFVDCLGPGATHEPLLQGVRALRRGGRAFNIGATAGGVAMDLHTMMDEQQSIEGSAWFTAGEGQDIADMAAAGTLNLSVFEHVKFPLDEVNQAINGIASRNGGFSNYVINP
ncbi:alcohol dehydrogenase catalytic domain-containing protein [Duganella radicis]|uniref:Alcohol dehydrogenase catalytic domain-containing protein n=1 Tax=Duganella radicis TaxID=551988 RepID=A0A6L6PE66_9BURK|nr:alcohol dehydrogenase catalytic domain-containing protein [Duganella radicis]MTV37009.1 alcohol dehydrogenase catalytic domain-containing protein [Duganella radicis]